MRTLKIGIIDLIAKAPTRTMWMRVMGANFASIMPQVTAAWCEGLGHDVTLITYTGREDLAAELPDKPDLVFIGSFTEAALLSYALSSMFRAEGAVTVIGGPHARCYPQDAQKYFDYFCEFCIDSSVPYQPLDSDAMKDDLRFLLRKLKRPRVAWHDPNFGVRFDQCMNAIEDAVPPNSIDFIAESTLSLLSETRVKRLRHNGFKALLPGIESWFELGNKSRTAKTTGMDKVRRVSEHVNMILQYIPYVQTNHIFGLDGDQGSAPFELTKKFLDLSPGAFPAYSMLSAFGQAAPLNLDYQRANRVLPFPFHFLSNIQMNIKPRNYSWIEFYDRVIDVTKYSFSPRMAIRRFMANGETIPRWLNVVRAFSSERYGRVKYYTEIRRLLKTDRGFRQFFEGENARIPRFFVEGIRKDLGKFWNWLPEGALRHNPNAYLESQTKACPSCIEPATK
jgi:hypothetical protein